MGELVAGLKQEMKAIQKPSSATLKSGSAAKKKSREGGSSSAADGVDH